MYLLTLITTRCLRQPVIEMFKGDWKSPAEVKKIVSKYRPNAEILSLEEYTVVKFFTTTDMKKITTEGN